jgi:uncharacterized protein YrrD
MLQNIKKICGMALSASDGEIGHVKDFYFDDQNWVVRYVVVDTGSWLAGRQVLLSPHAFGPLHQAGKSLRVNLTRKQIEKSPSIKSHKPVSRQYEEDYYRYYGWPTYWQGDGLWGTSAFPVLGMPPPPCPVEPVTATRPLPESADTHLRSALAVDGYRLEAGDGKIGHVCDLMIDPKSWAIQRLVIKTGWLSGKEVEIPTGKVDRISYDESTVYVNLTGKTVKQSPLRHRVANGSADCRRQIKPTARHKTRT